jgi:two-component system NtrC family sensor kinase
MMRAQDGRMWAEIPDGGFLTIALEVPREDPDRVRSFRPAPLNLTRSRTILVVDDDEAIRGALRAFLEKVGYQVKEAWSGRSALAALTSGRLPEIVLTDLKMSDGSGYWFLEELARDFPRLVRRTVIITGDADHEAATDLAANTGCPLVRKPFELPELLEILDQVSLRN